MLSIFLFIFLLFLTEYQMYASSIPDFKTG